MIPKIVHYAWFGSELPDTVQSRVEEWQEMLPGWEFKFWSEKNFDIDQYAFSSKMYHQGNLGYAADELRYAVLYQYGGFYFDTDMIVKKSLEPLLKHKMVWGFQYDNSLLTSFFGSEPGHPALKNILAVYAEEQYPELKDDKYHMTSNPFVTKIFLKSFPDFKTNGERQVLDSDLIVYPRDYFSYQSRNSEANYMQHLFDNSWGSANQGLKGRSKALFKQLMPYLWADISAKRGIKSAEADGVPLMKK